MEWYMKALQWEFLGNSLESYLTSLVIVAITLLAALVINRFLRRKLLNWTERTKTRLDDFIIGRIFPPIVYLIVIAGLAVAKENLEFDPGLDVWLNKILLAAGLAVFFMLLIRLCRGLVEVAAGAYAARLVEAAPEDLEMQLNTVDRIKKQVTEILNMILVVLALLTILSNLGVNLKAIWASLGIGGIAIVVAVKDPLSNLVGRMYIYSTGIFDEGHFILFGSWAGTVKRISLFRTYLELFSDMTTVSIPNADFRQRRGAELLRPDPIHVQVGPVPAVRHAGGKNPGPGGKTPGTGPKPNLKSTRTSPGFIWSALDDYAKVVRVWFQARLATWVDSLYYGNQMLHEIQLLSESEGIEFAFPTQTLHLKQDDPIDPGRSGPIPVALPESGE